MPRHNIPVVVNPYSVSKSSGFKCNFSSCCCLQCCPCFNLQYLTTIRGLTKIAQVGLGAICQLLLVKYILDEAKFLGTAYHGLLTTSAGCTLTNAILLVCFALSARSMYLINMSLYEILFNMTAFCLYLSSTSYFMMVSNNHLNHLTAESPSYYALYRTMTAVNYIGISAGIFHGFEALIALRNRFGYR